jgi:hypothetical protein
MRTAARKRLDDNSHALLLLTIERDGGFGYPPTTDPERLAAIAKQTERLSARRRRLANTLEVEVMRDKAKALRKEFKAKFAMLAGKYSASQDDRYPQEYRDREGAAILREMNILEATLSRDLILWSHGQKVEAARLRQIEPELDAAGETRKLREALEVDQLAKTYPSKTQAKNFLLPIAREALQAGNLAKARKHFAAAQQVGAFDGELERGINAALDMADPNRRKAVEVEVAAADELELGRRDVAAQRVLHQIGTQQELARASTVQKMADFKRKREAEFLLQESGIELGAAD